MPRTLRAVRIWIVLFVIALALSGITAFPLRTELVLGTAFLQDSGLGAVLPSAAEWVVRVRDGVVATSDAYPWVFYGTDWLAFAHLVIATAFIGPFRDPVRNRWIVRWAMLACVGVIPLALIAGGVRGIPVGWQLIDMSFGVIGIVPLLVLDRLIGRYAREVAAAAAITVDAGVGAPAATPASGAQAAG